MRDLVFKFKFKSHIGSCHSPTIAINHTIKNMVIEYSNVLLQPGGKYDPNCAEGDTGLGQKHPQMCLLTRISPIQLNCFTNIPHKK